MMFEMKIIKRELEFEKCLKQRFEFICEFSKVSPFFAWFHIQLIDVSEVIRFFYLRMLNVNFS